MATAKKKQGFRKIVINDKVFNWKFSGGIDVRPSWIRIINFLLIMVGMMIGFM